MKKRNNTVRMITRVEKTLLPLLIMICLLLSGCGDTANTDGADQNGQEISGQETASEEAGTDEEMAEENTEENYDPSMASIDTENSALYEMVDENISDEDLIKGEVHFSNDKAEKYASRVHCLFDMPTQQLVFQCKFSEIPSSDDARLYLFVLPTWADSIEDVEEPTFIGRKGHTMQFQIEYDRTYLFARFQPALLVDGKYVAVSEAKYMTNPETLAPNQEDYPEMGKKGLLLDPATIGDEKLTNLGIKQAIYNIPLSHILGETSNPDIPTIEFEYNDQIYYFNGAAIAAYDGLFTYLTENGIYSTAIILNDWNEAYPELIHPKSRNKTSKSLYYAFNTESEEGVRLMEACALFLAERYSSGFYGMVHNWVIANEINQQTVWNYMDTSDLEYYTETFEKSFRIFYNAIRSRYSNAGVYFSVDHDWNDNKGKNSKWFNGRELLETFNTIARRGGNYDWGIAIHPYPNPLTRVNYWSEKYDMTENADILTIMNLSSITNILEKAEFRETDGTVRSLTITELGFTSKSGEKLQAAAFAYCYYIIENNSYVDSFMMNRETDAYEEMRTGLSFGVYNPDLSEKYIMQVFRDIDTDQAETHKQFMLNILGADTLEEALSWAQP